MQKPFNALWTDAVGKKRVGMLGYVLFDALPVVLVITNVLAVSTDGQDSLERLDLAEEPLEFVHALAKDILDFA